jgi:hypothetical protein
MDNEFKYEQMGIRTESLIMKIAKLIAILMFVGSLLLSISQ